MDLEIVKGFEQYATYKSNPLGGIAIKFKFENGRGASVIRNKYSYGANEGLWELAVLDEEDLVDYSTPITNDVIGWLDVENVHSTLKRIQALEGE